jgi:hypothetical protein
MRYDLPPQMIMTYCERVGVLPSVVCRLANRSPFIIIRARIGLGQFIAVANMEAALGDLRAARASLQKAVENKSEASNHAPPCTLRPFFGGRALTLFPHRPGP